VTRMIVLPGIRRSGVNADGASAPMIGCSRPDRTRSARSASRSRSGSDSEDFARTALIIDGIVGRKHNADSRAWDGLLADPVTRARTLVGIAKACSWSGEHALRWASKDADAMSRQIFEHTT
jgi:hypothetical protein